MHILDVINMLIFPITIIIVVLVVVLLLRRKIGRLWLTFEEISCNFFDDTDKG